jgi:hypothetical protein
VERYLNAVSRMTPSKGCYRHFFSYTQNHSTAAAHTVPMMEGQPAPPEPTQAAGSWRRMRTSGMEIQWIRTTSIEFEPHSPPARRARLWSPGMAARSG